MKFTKFALVSVAVMMLFASSTEAKFNFGGAARVGRDADKPLTSELTYADLQSGKYKLSLKSGWDRNANGIHFSTWKEDGIKYVGIGITERLAIELSQREGFKDNIYKAIGGFYGMQVPEHNLDGIEIKSRDNVTYTDKNGDEIAKAVDVYIPMSVVSGDCKGELVRGKGNFSGYSYCLADDLDDVFTKRSWF